MIRTRFKCKACDTVSDGRRPRGGWGERGDGTVIYPRRHKVEGVACPGNIEPAEWVRVDDGEGPMPPVMVDELKVWPGAWGPFLEGSAHLTVDGPVKALHLFARQIGLGSRWFQDGKIPRYDLTPQRRDDALRHGAVEVSMRDQARARTKARRGAGGDR